MYTREIFFLRLLLKSCKRKLRKERSPSEVRAIKKQIRECRKGIRRLTNRSRKKHPYERRAMSLRQDLHRILLGIIIGLAVLVLAGWMGIP